MEIHETEIIQERGARSQVNWGALFAGLVFILAASWLMLLLGSAIGVSVLDATDMDAADGGFGIGTTIWILLTGIVVYFLGSMLTARLSGSGDETTGALHGVTLWGLATAATLWIGIWGVSGLIGAGASVVGGVVSSVGSAGSAAISAGKSAGASIDNLIETEIGTELQASIKRQASQVVANTQDQNGARASASELRSAVDQIDNQDLQAIAADLVQGNTQDARTKLRSATGLSQAEVTSLIDGLEGQLENLTETQVAQNLRTSVQNQMRNAAQQVSQIAGPEVSQDELMRAIEQLDAETLAAVGRQLIMGNPERAKDTLAINTSLSENEIEAIVDGVSDEVDQRVAAAKQELEERVEVASTYATAALWSAFAASAIALLMAILGGTLGAKTVTRLHVTRVERDVRA